MNVGEKATLYWNKEKLSKLVGKKKLLLLPNSAGDFLFSVGLMNQDASISADQVKKYLQINHMLSLFWPAMEELRKQNPGKTLHVVDVGCGNSYLSFALVQHWLSCGYPEKELLVLGLDTNAKVIEQASKRAAALGFSNSMQFLAQKLADSTQQIPEKVHAVIALHACDTATDEALAFGVHCKAQLMAIAPCCQAELATFWSELSARTNSSSGNSDALKMALSIVINTPQLRRESAATLTDALRLALVRSCGFEVTATEFVPSTHTPKNRLLLCKRRGNYHLPSSEEYRLLKAGLGNPLLKLEELLRDHLQALPVSPALTV